jgi:hypothetical protein
MSQNNPLPGGEVALFEAPDGQIRLDVRLEQDTVWLSQAQMAELFGRERSVITKHINNVFKEGELGRDSVCANFAHTPKVPVFRAAEWEVQATVAKNATTAIYGFTGVVECITRKAAETAREQVL